MKNFGDALAVLFLERLFIGDPVEAKRIYLIGSVIDEMFINSAVDAKFGSAAANDKIVFWGCGLRSAAGLSIDSRSRAEFPAVRGPLTRSLLQLSSMVPIGDPALLLPALHEPRPVPELVGKTLCIPHFHDQRSTDELISLGGCDLLVRPNIGDDTAAITTFIDQIASADFVLSASLHGAITAAAYGKPFAFWDNGLIDLPFKWHDFAASIGIECQFHRFLDAAREHYDAVIRPAMRLPLLWPLLVAAPFAVRPDAFVRVVRTDTARYGLAAFDASVPPSLIDRLSDSPTGRAHRKKIEFARMSDRLAQTAGDKDRLESELSRQAAKLQAVKRSTSWRITRPMRIIARSWTSITGKGHATETRLTLHTLRAFSVKQKATTRDTILVASNMLPMFDKHSGGLRLKNIIQILSEMGWRIIFASRAKLDKYEWLLTSPAERIRYEATLKGIGVERIAYGIQATERVLRKTGAELRFAFLSFPEAANDLIPLVRCHAPWTTILYDMVDFHAVRLEREARVRSDEGLQAEAERLRTIELSNARTCDVTIAISDDEKRAVLELLPEAVVHVVPNVFEMPDLPPDGLRDREGLLFVGGFWHRPNADAVLWFVREIWPLIREQKPDLTFRIVGSNAPEEIVALNGKDGIEVAGFVPDLTDLFQRSRLFVAPLRYGAGVKGKVGQSMAYGLPVVTTSIGAEGMQARDGEDILVADSPEAFARAVTRLAADDMLWQRLHTNGRALIEQTQSMPTVRRQLEGLLHA